MAFLDLNKSYGQVSHLNLKELNCLENLVDQDFLLLVYKCMIINQKLKLKNLHFQKETE